MNGIKVNGEFLDLFPDTKVTFSLNNPIFADDNIIPGSYSLDISIPYGELSPTNTRILSNRQVIENNQRLRQIDAYYFYDDLKFKKGKLVIGKLDQTNNKLTVNFKTGLSLLENIKNLKLKDVVNETIVLNNNTTYVKEVRLDPLLAAPYHIILNGRPYEASTIDALVTAINADATEPRVSATTFSTYLKVKPYTDQLNIKTPFTVDCEDGREWTVTPNDETWNLPIRTALETYLHEPYPSDKFRLPTIINKGQYEAGWQLFDTSMVNMSKDGTIEINTSASEGDGIVNFNPFNSIVYTSVTPFVMLSHVLDRIAAHYGFIYEGDFTTHAIALNALIYTPNTLCEKIPFIGKYNFLFLRQHFNLGEFVPDMTVADFFKALQTRFNLAVYYKENEKRLVMRFRKAIHQNKAYIDITSKSSPVLDSEDIGVKGVLLEFDRDKGDTLCPVDNFAVGTESEITITTKCGPLAQDSAYIFASLPAVKQLLTDSPYASLRLFFYDGLQSSDTGTPFVYPKATSKLPDTTDFNFESLYYLFWQEHIRFLMTRTQIELNCAFSFAPLVMLNWERKVMFDRVKYLYQQIETSFTMNANEASESKTLLYKA
jgi:hypothetical protein